MDEDDQLLSTGEVAKLLGVNQTTLARAVRLGHLPALKVGRVYAVKREDAERWYAKHYRPTMVRPRKRPRPRNRR